jgi:nucleoside triphosphate pyrophosphatase
VTPVILASESRVRARLLTAAGVCFDVVPARVDEETAKQSLLSEGAASREIAGHLAELKAVRVSMSRPQTMVIGADQVLVFRRKIVSKVSNLDAARAVLHRFAGQTHELISAIVIAKDGAPVWRHSAQVRLQMRQFSDEFLGEYLAAEGETVLDSVGCYHLEGRGAQLFSAIAGDYFTALGLPLLPLLAALREFGVLVS